MSDTFAKIQALVLRGDYLVSNHAYDEILNDRISADDLLQSLANAETIEDYPDAGRGPSVCCYNMICKVQFIRYGECQSHTSSRPF